MTKNELIAVLVDKINASKSDVQIFMSALEQVIHEELVNGGEITLANTGKFKVRETKERVGRNPKTGESIHIPAGRKVTFTPSKNLKDAII